MFESNEWGLADLGRAALGVRVYGSAAISFAKVLSGRLLTYIYLLATMGLRCGKYLRGKFWAIVFLRFRVSPADFKTCQPVMMVPIEMQEEIQSYIYERKEN